MTKELTPQEKIDYIYKRLKKEEQVEKRNFIIKWGFRSIIAGFIAFMYFYGINMIIQGVVQQTKLTIESNFNKIGEKSSDALGSIKEKIFGRGKSGY